MLETGSRRDLIFLTFNEQLPCYREGHVSGNVKHLLILQSQEIKFCMRVGNLHVLFMGITSGPTIVPGTSFSD